MEQQRATWAAGETREPRAAVAAGVARAEWAAGLQCIRSAEAARAAKVTESLGHRAFSWNDG